MKHALSSTLALGAALVLLGACSLLEGDKAAAPPAEPAPAAAAPTLEAEPAPSAPSGRAAPTAAPAAIRYACTGTKDSLTVAHAANGATARISFGSQNVVGKHAANGHYTAAHADLLEKGNTATLTWRGKKYSCKARS